MDQKEKEWVLKQARGIGDKEVAEAMKDDSLVVVGANAVNIDNEMLQKFLARGSKKDRRCMKCQGQVYLSPTSEELVAGMAEPKVLCLSCAMSIAKEGEVGYVN
jgi:glutathione synthase/RimK-type ligase-like ATP-grasp enzyme